MTELAEKPKKTPKNTKVLFVITKSNFGGAQRYVYDLAVACTRGPYDVAVAFGGTGAREAATGALETKLKDAGVRTIRIQHFMRDMSLVDDVRAFFELLSLIRTEHPDVLHVTSSKAGGIGALAGRLAHVPRIVFTSHGLTFEESWRPVWQRLLIRLFTWGTILLAHATILISRDTYERARRMPFSRNRVHLVYNGITPPDYLPRAEARRVLAGHDAPHDLWIGSVAELHPNKNLGLLIDAVCLMHKRGTHAHAWLIGDGEQRDVLKKQADDAGVAPYVHFAGYVENASRLFPAFDVVVLPSLKEGLPYVLMEAGGAGCAVVASNISGNNEIIVHDVSGILVPHDATALADVLERLVNDPDMRARYGAALRQRVTETFSAERMYEETRALYV